MSFTVKSSEHLDDALSLLTEADEKSGSSNLWPKTGPTLLRLFQEGRPTGAAYCAYKEPQTLESTRFAFFVHVAPLILNLSGGVALLLAKLRHNLTLADAGELKLLTWETFGDGYTRPTKRVSKPSASRLARHVGLGLHDVVMYEAEAAWEAESARETLVNELTAFRTETKGRADRAKARFRKASALNTLWLRYERSLAEEAL